MNRGVVRDAEKFRQHFLVDFLGEGLSFIFIALAMTFEAMAEDFMEEDRSSASAKKRGAVVGLGDRRFAQIFEVRGDLVDLAGQIGFAGKAGGGRGLKGFDANQFHAVIGARFRFHDQACAGAG